MEFEAIRIPNPFFNRLNRAKRSDNLFGALSISNSKASFLYTYSPFPNK
jgi:hypothetical protein